MKLSTIIGALGLLACVAVLVAVLVVVPVMAVYATVDACGWRGLFVQCRIEARP